VGPLERKKRGGRRMKVRRQWREGKEREKREGGRYREERRDGGVGESEVKRKERCTPPIFEM